MSNGPRATSISTAELRYSVLDVFTDVRFTGNSLAVVHDADELEDQTMLAVARETRLAETTFVQSSGSPDADYRNRIFSMAGELPFAGHPSLGTAVAIARAQDVRGSVRYVQETQTGRQSIDVDLDREQAHAAMLQEPAQFGPELDPTQLLLALGLSHADGHPELSPQVVSTGLNHVMLPLGSSRALARIASDIAMVDSLLTQNDAYGLYAAWCDPERGRARARLFARSAQITEDPATGSAAGALCAYLERRAGCSQLEILQGVELGRPSRLSAEVAGGRVRVGGKVVAIIDGILHL